MILYLHGFTSGPQSVKARALGDQQKAVDAEREVVDTDFDQFDLILAMDWDNLALLEERCPPHCRRKLGRLTEHCRLHDSPVVPDPYAGGAQGFEEVLDLVEDACDGLVTMLRRQRGAA